MTDYSLVEDPISNQGDTPRIVAPTAPETFGDAKQLTYVVGSDVPGGMGPDLIPLSDSADVDSFVSSYGGRTMTFDDVTPQWLSQYTG